MRIVVQRVSRARVTVAKREVGAIGPGMLLLVGVERGDGTAQVKRAVHRFASLRIFSDAEGKMNLSLAEIGGEVLVVSQFTLAGSIKRGRRPDFFAAAPPEEAEPLITQLIEELSRQGVRVASGVFRATMDVELVNCGPATFVWEDRPGQ